MSETCKADNSTKGLIVKDINLATFAKNPAPCCITFQNLRRAGLEIQSADARRPIKELKLKLLPTVRLA